MEVGTPPHQSIPARLHVNRRSLQIALGVIWIVDGLLKFQPALLKPAFVDNIVRPMSVGQPTLVASTIDHMANFLSHEATMWVVVFGLTEIAIGAAMLFSRPSSGRWWRPSSGVPASISSARGWGWSSPGTRHPWPVLPARCASTCCSG